MHSVRFFFLVIALLFFINGSSYCQRPPIVCGEITVSQGLLPGSVNTIHQDYLGYIWVGTKSGLNRYDTKTVKTYLGNNGTSSCFKGDLVRIIFEDKQDRLWIGTNIALNLYNRATDSFSPIYLPDSSAYSAQSLREMSPHIYLGTNKGLFRLDEKTLAIHPVVDNASGKPITNDVRDIHFSSDHEVWISSSAGLKRFEFGQTGSFSHIETYNTNSGHLSDNSVFDIIEPETGKIWISSKSGGINIYDKFTQSFSYLTVESGDSIKISSNDVRAMMKDRQGGIWIGTFNGLEYYHPEVGQIHYSTMEGERGSLNHNSVLSLFEDEKGSIWVGTFYGGVNLLDRDVQAFKNFTSDTHKNSISHNIVSSIAEDEEGNLWIGTEGGGLNFVDAKQGKISHFTHQKGALSGISHDNVKALKLDRSGNLWIGTYDGGLNLLAKGSKDFRVFKSDKNNQNSISNNNIYSIAEDHEGTLWFGTFGGGLNKMSNGQMERFIRYSSRAAPEHKISSNLVRIVYEDSRKNLWVGTENGLNVKYFGETTFTVFLNDPTDQKGISGNAITSVFEDSKGRLWVGTYSHGLNLFNYTTGTFTYFFDQNGLSGTSIAGIQEDDDGYLWLSTNSGLYKFDPENGVTEKYNAADGIAGNVFLGGSSAKLRDGRLAFGSTNGLTVFRPNKESFGTATSPQLVFTDFRLANQPQKLGESLVMHTDISLVDKLTLSHEQNNFSFDFASLNFLFPHKNKFAYMLEGFDKDWQYVDVPTCTYTNLDPGSYTLLINGTDNRGVWAETPKKLTIEIKPPYWETWWAYLSYLAVAAFAVVKIIQFNRSKSMLEKRLFLEKSEREKQIQINEEKLRFFTNVSHEFRTPLTLILGPVDLALSRLPLNSEHKSVLTTVKSNANRLLGLINQLIDFRKVEAGKYQPRFSKSNLVDFVQKTLLPFQFYAENEKITLAYQAALPHIPVYIDTGMIETVIANLLSNALKYRSDEGKIVVDVYEVGKSDRYPHGAAIIQVTDNGVGIPANELPFIFDRFYQGSSKYKTGGEVANSSGVGLSLAKNLVELNGGQLFVESHGTTEGQENKTIFRIILPLGRDHVDDSQILETPIAKTFTNDSPALTTLDAPPINPIPKKKTEHYKVLIVEDNKQLREFTKYALSEHFSVLDEENGEKAWTLIVNEMPDLIISDVMMPGIDGFELVNRIKADSKTSHIPVILLTAKDGSPDKLRGYQNGVDHYITKPFELEILVLTAMNILESRERQKHLFTRQFLINPQSSEIENPDKDFLIKLLAIVEQNLDKERFSVKELTTEIGISRPVLYRKLKQLTGLSVIDFINQVRFKKAAALLKTSKLGVLEVATLVGFHDPKHFRKSFKQFFGCNPSEYGRISEEINERA